MGPLIKTEIWWRGANFYHIYPSQRQNLLPTLEISNQNFQNFHNFQDFSKPSKNIQKFQKIQNLKFINFHNF